MRRIQRLYSTRPAMLGLAFALSALLAAPAFAQDADPPVSTAMRQALQRDLGMTPEQILQYLHAEKRMPDIERKARGALKKHYAGSWLEQNQQGEYVSVVAVSSTSEAGKAHALGVQIRVVTHSLVQLQTTQARLDAMVGTLRVSGKDRKLDPSIHSWYVDPISNRVVITTDRGARGVAIDFVAASGVDAKTVRFTEADGRPQLVQQANFDVRGGDRYNLPGGGSCSIGFAVTLGAQNGFVTAGHCGINSTTVTNTAGQSLGYIFDSVFPGSDFAVVHNTNPLGIPRPWVNAYAFGGNLNVRGSNPAALNAVVCRSGARTGARCGTLLATGVTVPYPSGPVFNLSSSTACVGAGDSGGSFVTPEGQAQGVTSGGSFYIGTDDNCATPLPAGSESSYYQPLQPILANYPGLTLVVAP